MIKLKINQSLVTPDNAAELQKICPFGAIDYKDSKLDIGAACKMCKMCVRKGPSGVVEIEDIPDDAAQVDKSEWRGICVYVDHARDEIHRVTYELIGKAHELAKVTGHPVYALFIGNGIEDAAENLLHYGVDRVYVYDDAAFEDFRIEPYTNAFYDFVQKAKPSSVLVGATNLGRQLAPRIAARCKTGLTADCTVLEMKENTDLVQIRPAFGGNIMAQIITTNTRPQFCTARYKVFTEPQRQDSASGEIIKMAVDDKMKQSAIEVLKVVEKPKDVDISEADCIVAVGRALKSRDDIAMVKELADLLSAEVACTRPLVEGGFFDAKHQIGLSGRTVKPKFIITLGISGAVQFAAGMKSSDCIVAINSDKSAPIFDVAHYGIVGDIYEIVPKLIEKIKEARK